MFDDGIPSIDVDVELSETGDWICEFPVGGEKSFDGEPIPDNASASFSRMVGKSNPPPEIELCLDTSRFKKR